MPRPVRSLVLAVLGLALAPSDSAVFVGGEMTSVNGGVRKGIAALDAKSGALDTSFTADTNNEVLDLQLSADGSRLFLAGSFTAVQGQPRSKMASIVTSTGSSSLADALLILVFTF